MKITLNDREHNIAQDHSSLIPLLKNNELYHSSGIAIAINDEIIPKSDWENYQCKENDNILIITATQGG